MIRCIYIFLKVIEIIELNEILRMKYATCIKFILHLIRIFIIDKTFILSFQ